MSDLTVFMPSNRDFKASFRAIETALRYCELRNAKLVVADNSGDPAKWSYWHQRSVLLSLINTEGMDAKANFLAALESTSSTFVLAMGDDDELFADLSRPEIDYSSIPQDHIGVRPKTEVWTNSFGLLRSKTFSIEGSTPNDRMLEYNEKADGDNGAFYSIFRREPYVHLMNLFFRHHPTGGGYGDWALVMALFAWGNLSYDPGTIFRYNFDQWYGSAALEKRADSLYQAVGLPEGSRHYQYLFMFLDIFVYCCIGFSPQNPDDASNAQSTAAGPFLDAFLKKVASAPDLFPIDMHGLCYKISNQTFAFDRFLTGLEMAEQVQSGLGERYIRFFNKAMGDTA